MPDRSGGSREAAAYWIPGWSLSSSSPRRDPVAGYDGSRHACFPPLLAPNKDREIGGGRATRQPGQVRKEAALTRSGSGRSSVSYLFFRANRAKAVNRPAPDSAPARIPQK